MDRFLTAWRPRTAVFAVVGIVLILVGLAVSFSLTNFKPTTSVKLGSSVYALTLADTEAKQIQGLSGVQSLEPNGGLLMAFKNSTIQGIWMKDMNIPLDIIWLDDDKRVIYIVKNAQPEDPPTTIYKPLEPSRYVIEVPAGSVQKAGIKTGEIAEFVIAS